MLKNHLTQYTFWFFLTILSLPKTFILFLFPSRFFNSVMSFLFFLFFPLKPDLQKASFKSTIYFLIKFFDHCLLIQKQFILVNQRLRCVAGNENLQRAKKTQLKIQTYVKGGCLTLNFNVTYYRNCQWITCLLETYTYHITKQ